MKKNNEKNKHLEKTLYEIEDKKFTGKVIIDYYEGKPIVVEERVFKKKKL